ncbi:MAG: DinB family protein [Thermoanaerobaculia bacterium]
MPAREIELLLITLDQAFDKKSWHGTNLRGSLRGVTAAEASWRPSSDRHNIWELALHAAYWKYIVRRRLVGERRGSFPRQGSDWFERPNGCTDSDWKDDVRLLVEIHRGLREAVAGLRASDLGVTPRGSRVSNLDMIAGVVAHDLYHTGQIQLLKRLGAKA